MPEIDNLDDAVAPGQSQPFSLADLGLSPEEIAAMGMGDAAVEPEPPAAPQPPPGDVIDTGVVIDRVEFDPAGRDYTGEFVLIKNTAPVSVDLTNWTLQDVGTKHRFVFPPFCLGQDLVRLWTRRGVNDRPTCLDSTGASGIIAATPQPRDAIAATAAISAHRQRAGCAGESVRAAHHQPPGTQSRTWRCGGAGMCLPSHCRSRPLR